MHVRCRSALAHLIVFMSSSGSHRDSLHLCLFRCLHIRILLITASFPPCIGNLTLYNLSLIVENILQPPFKCIFHFFHYFSLIRVFTSFTQLGINESGLFDLVWIMKGRWRLAYVLYRSLPRLIPFSLPFELAGRVRGSGSEVLSIRRASFLLSSGFVAEDNWGMGELCQIKFLTSICHWLVYCVFMIGSMRQLWCFMLLKMCLCNVPGLQVWGLRGEAVALLVVMV